MFVAMLIQVWNAPLLTIQLPYKEKKINIA